MNLIVVIVELDAKALVDALNNPSYSNSAISPLFDDCKQLAIRIPHLCIRHIYREANKCVDRFDSLALLQPLDLSFTLVHLWTSYLLLRLITKGCTLTGFALNSCYLVSFNLKPRLPKKSIRKKNIEQI